MTPDEYIEARLDDQIGWYDRKSAVAQRNFKYLRLAEIVCAAMIPLLSGHVDPEWPQIAIAIGVLGAIVAVVAGVLGLYQFEHRWVEYRTTCESLRKARYLFLTGTEPFDRDTAENYQLLVQRVETLISKENTSWGQYMMKPREDENAD